MAVPAANGNADALQKFLSTAKDYAHRVNETIAKVDDGLIIVSKSALTSSARIKAFTAALIADLQKHEHQLLRSVDEFRAAHTKTLTAQRAILAANMKLMATARADGMQLSMSGTPASGDAIAALESRLATAVGPVLDLLSVPSSETPLILSESEVKKALHQNAAVGGPAAPLFAGYLSEPNSLLLQWNANPIDASGPPVRAFQVMMDAGTIIAPPSSPVAGAAVDVKSTPASAGSPSANGDSKLSYATLTDPKRSERRQYREVYHGQDSRCHVTGLASGTTYMVKVRARSDAGFGPWNEAKIVATLPSPHEVYCIGGLEAESKSLATCERYDTAAGNWFALPAMSTRRANTSAVALNGKLVLVGGDDGLFPLDSVECFDPYSLRWIPLASMAVKRSACAAVTVYSKLYALGGTDSAQNLFYNSCEVFNPTTNSWKSLTPMICKRRSFCAVATEDHKILVFGGVAGSNLDVCQAEVYDPLADGWTAVPIPQKIGPCSGCTLNGTVYLGLETGQLVRYEAKSHALTVVADYKRRGAMISALNGKVYVVGGVDAKEHAISIVEVYDPQSSTLTQLAPLLTPRYGAGICS